MREQHERAEPPRRRHLPARNVAVAIVGGLVLALVVGALGITVAGRGDGPDGTER